MAYDLSVIITARNEEWLPRTVKGVLDNKRGNTEVIVVLDGGWPPKEGVAGHQDLTIIYHHKALGQRASINEAARLSKARYIMKLDAHCIVDEGFDIKLMADCEPNWIVIPAMYNLHAFDWVCNKCANRWYQGPTPTHCCSDDQGKVKNDKCDSTSFRRDIIWQPRWRKRTEFMRFDNTLHFQYHGERGKTAEAKFGIIRGYNLSFDTKLIPLGIINLLTDLANSHQLTCRSNFRWFGKNVTPDTVSFDSVDIGRAVGTDEVLSIGNKSEVNGITTTPIVADVVNDWDIFASSSGNFGDKPGINETMCECFLSEIGASSISRFVDSSSPVPAAGSIVYSDLIKKINNVLGGNFVYSEKTKCFHNGSVTLKLVLDKELADTMSFVGACFFMPREWYWYINGSEETWGSWGNQGTELSCKTWLSGGRVVVNKKTWFSHLFRTQGGDFGFPYPQSEKQIDNARKKSREMFMGNTFEKQIYPLYWLVKKFWPIPGWDEADLARLLDLSISFSGVSGGTDFTNSRPAAWDSFRKFMASNTKNLSGLLSTVALPSENIDFMADKSEVQGITTQAVIADVVNHGDVFPKVSGDGRNKPGINNSMGSDFLTEVSHTTVSKVISVANPIPAPTVPTDTDFREKSHDSLGVKVWDSKKASVLHSPHSTLSKGIIFYTDNQLKLEIAKRVQKNLKQCADEHFMPIVSASLKPMKFGTNVHLKLTRGYLTMFKQILAALEAIDTDIVFFCEHDVLYSSSHFDFTPTDPNVWYYNENVWKVNADTGHAVHYDCKQVSGIAVYRKTAIEHYRKRVALVEEKQALLDAGKITDKDFNYFIRRMGFEPGTHNRAERVDEATSASWKSESPNVDIRHGKNLSATRWRIQDFRNQDKVKNWIESNAIPGWGITEGRFWDFLKSL